MKKFLLVVFLLALTSCGGGNTEEAPIIEQEVVVIESVSPERDLGGMVINIANWWADGETATIEPNSITERARWDDRREQEELYNFTMREVRYGSWHDVRDNLQMELLSENRDFQIWIVIPQWFATNHSQRLFSPIPLEHFDYESGIEWNRSVIELTMRDGQPHGFAHGVGMAGGVYFNMRLLEEAGLERDLPFRLQAENNWTWETFTDMARHLSHDTDSDGITDTWAITAFHQEVIAFALASNGAAFATINPETGRFENSTDTDAFREVVEWMVLLREEGLAFHEDDIGGAWNAFIQMFDSGHGAIRVAPNYVSGNIQLADDWGFVAFPRGPRSDVHYAWVTQDINAIPYFYTEQEIDDIMFAMQRWIRPIEDGDTSDWMFDAYSNHPDPRSVEETMVHFTRNPNLQSTPAHSMMPGLGNTLDVLFAHRVWVGNDASVIIEEAQQVWDSFLERVNNLGG
ncbi:MAG: extracellular solute-binding protein [Clostridiales bacterium]|nr:extracellular solute-binding protein [Clostridiales bacterium]